MTGQEDAGSAFFEGSFGCCAFRIFLHGGVGACGEDEEEGREGGREGGEKAQVSTMDLGRASLHLASTCLSSSPSFTSCCNRANKWGCNDSTLVIMTAEESQAKSRRPLPVVVRDRPPRKGGWEGGREGGREGGNDVLLKRCTIQLQPQNACILLFLRSLPTSLLSPFPPKNRAGSPVISLADIRRAGSWLGVVRE